MIYAFFRKDGFYMIELADDKQACANALINPGTIRVERAGSGEQVWPPKHDS